MKHSDLLKAIAFGFIVTVAASFVYSLIIAELVLVTHT